MKKIFKRIFSSVLALILILTFNSVSFASELTKNNSTIKSSENVLNDDYGIMPLSSTSGYASKTIHSKDKTITIKCSSSGTGGMGITIQVDYTGIVGTMKFAGEPFKKGTASEISGTIGLSNNVIKFNDLYQSELDYYTITFDVPDNVSVPVKVWIYG